MKPPKGLLNGPKFSNNHSTVIREAVPILSALKEHESVRKVVVSEVKRLRAGGRRLKWSEIPAGLRLVVRGTGAQQEFFVYTSDRRSVRDAIS